MFGRMHFLTAADEHLEGDLYELVQSIDGLIDNFDGMEAGKCINRLQKIKDIVSSQYTLSDKDGASETCNAIGSLQNIMRLMIDGKADEIIKFCSSDESFIRNWGMPSHFGIFQKR